MLIDPPRDEGMPMTDMEAQNENFQAHHRKKTFKTQVQKRLYLNVFCGLRRSHALRADTIEINFDALVRQCFFKHFFGYNYCFSGFLEKNS